MDNVSSLPTFAAIKLGLMRLSRKQVEEIRATCGMILKVKTGSTSVAVEDEDWLLLGIFTELERRGLESKGGYFRLKKTNSFRGYLDGSLEVRELLEQATPGFTAVQHRALGQLAGRELASYIESWRGKIPVSRDIMLNHVRQVPQAIEHAFPGYMASGMLAVVITHEFSDGR